MKAGKGVVFVTRDEPIEREATRATRELVDAPLNRHRLGREALELARSFYDAKRWMHDLEALYAEIVGAPTARPRP
jgi:hypothetical protein